MLSAGTSTTSPASPTPTSWSCRHGRSRGTRRRLPQQGDRHLGAGPAQYVAYQADADLKGTIVEVAEVFTRHMGMNPTFKPFSDKRVRQAINHAIDTDLIINKLVKGKAYRATSWLPLTSPLYDKTMKPYAFDPAKAKQLLADAGYPKGFEFEWTTSQNESWGLPIVEAVIPMLDKGGHQGEGRAGRDRGAGGGHSQGRVPGLCLFEGDRSRSPGRAQMLPLGDAAIGLQLHEFKTLISTS